MAKDAYEDAIKRFLRKISPLRNWEYISEVEHAWMTELCDELEAEFKNKYQEDGSDGSSNNHH